MTRFKLPAVVVSVLLLGSWAAAQAPNLEGMDLVLRAMQDGPVARVNGVDITREEFSGLYVQEVESLKRRAQKEVPDHVRLDTGLLCLRTLVQRELLYQEAVRQKMTVPEKEVQARWDAEMAQMKKAFPHSAGKEPTEEEILAAAGANREEAMGELRKALLIEAMRAKIAKDKKLDVPSSDIEAFFKEHAGEFKHPATVHLNQIYAGFKPSGKPEDEKKKADARQKIETAIKRMQAGETFAGVAKAVSEAPDAERGGDLGPMPAEALPPFYLEAAKKLKPGEISGVIESEFGFHVIKLIEAEDAGEVTLEQAEPHIKRMLLAEGLERSVAEWCDQFMKKPGCVQVFLQLERILATRPDLLKAAEQSQAEAAKQPEAAKADTSTATAAPASADTAKKKPAKKK